MLRKFVNYGYRTQSALPYFKENNFDSGIFGENLSVTSTELDAKYKT